MAAPPAPGRRGRPRPLRGRSRHRPPRSPRCAPGRAPVPGPRPRRRASSEVGCGHCASRRGADAGRVGGEECASPDALGFGAGALGAARSAGKLLWAQGRSSAQGRGKKGKDGSPGVPRLPPSGSCPHPRTSRALVQLCRRGFYPGPAPGWGLRGRRPPGSAFAALCSALPAPPLRSRPARANSSPGVRVAPLAAPRAAGPGLKAPRAPAPGNSALEANLSPRSSVSPTLAQAPWSPKKEARFSREQSWSKGP